ncbi:MAG: branched-chain amino acid ABC transporter permease, partial [Abditibacteriaceae bacterium]
MWRTWLARLLVVSLCISALFALQAVLASTINDYVVQIIILAGINIILAVSLNLINGVTGQFSLGHAGFMAIGAYSGGVFSFYAIPKFHVPDMLQMPGTIIVAALFAAFAGWLVGLPSLRLRGDYLTIVTLGFGEIVRVILTTINEVGGARGFNGLPKLTNFVWVFGMVLLCLYVMRNIATSSLGRAMQAVREDEVAAEASGINTTKTKVWAFVISSMWAGVAGALLVHYNQSANPDTFNFIESVLIVIMVVLGGLGSITGAAIAAVLLTLLDNVLRSASGAIVVAIILTGYISFLLWQRWRESKSTFAIKAKYNWIIATVAMLLGVGLLYQFAEPWLAANISELRYVIFAVILIVTMLLRPQGLMGRKEWGWHSIPFLNKRMARESAEYESVNQDA